MICTQKYSLHSAQLRGESVRSNANGNDCYSVLFIIVVASHSPFPIADQIIFFSNSISLNMYTYMLYIHSIVNSKLWNVLWCTQRFDTTRKRRKLIKAEREHWTVNSPAWRTRTHFALVTITRILHSVSYSKRTEPNFGLGSLSFALCRYVNRAVRCCWEREKSIWTADHVKMVHDATLPNLTCIDPDGPRDRVMCLMHTKYEFSKLKSFSWRCLNVVSDCLVFVRYFAWHLPYRNQCATYSDSLILPATGSKEPNEYKGDWENYKTKP